MKHIRIKKNGGVLLIEPLENGLSELKDGDEYVYLGKCNEVLCWESVTVDDERIGKVIWDYGVGAREMFVCGFDEVDYAQRVTFMRMVCNSTYGTNAVKSLENAPRGYEITPGS